MGDEDEMPPTYHAVPPPSDSVAVAPPPPPPPPGVTEEQWNKLHELHTRRLKTCGPSMERRKEQLRKSAVQRASEALAVSSSSVPVTSPSSSPPTPQPSTREPDRRATRLQRFGDPNPQLRGVDHGRFHPKTALEELVDAAIARGDYAEAERLSDALSAHAIRTVTRRAAEREEFETRDKEAQRLQSRRRRVLPWTFQHKARWERKGNM